MTPYGQVDLRLQHRVRLAGIDATEKGQPFGKASRQRLGELGVDQDNNRAAVRLSR